MHACQNLLNFNLNNKHNITAQIIGFGCYPILRQLRISLHALLNQFIIEGTGHRKDFFSTYAVYKNQNEQ